MRKEKKKKKIEKTRKRKIKILTNVLLIKLLKNMSFVIFYLFLKAKCIQIYNNSVIDLLNICTFIAFQKLF